MKRLKLNLLLSVLLGILCVSTGYAQNKVSTGGGGGFTFGYGYQDISKLHDFLPAGVKDFGKMHTLIGGTGHGFIGNLVIGGGGAGIIGDEISTDTFKYSAGGGLGTFDFGYLLLNRDKVNIYPMIGIGGYGYGLNIVRTVNISRNDIVENPAREINLSTGGLVLDLSMNFDLIPMLQYDEKEEAYGGFMIGLKMGYLYSMPTSNWNFSGVNVSGGPDFGLNMLYAKLVIGGFGFSK